MRVKLYGVRGSLPSGITGEAVEKKVESVLQRFVERGYTKKEDIRPFLAELPFFQRGTYGSCTMCIEVRSETGAVLFDSGSGIRSYGVEYFRREEEFHIFQTHFHWDHTCGLPFFIPIYMPGKRLNFYSPHERFEQGVQDLFQPPYFPVPYSDLPSERRFHRVKKYVPILLHGMEITPFQLDHPNEAFGYHIAHEGKRLVICFDAEFKRMSRRDLGEDLKFYQNADLILFDGQYTISEVLKKIDWGHCTAQVGVDLCLREGIKRLVIVHHDPESSDEKLHELEQAASQYYQTQYQEMKRDNPQQPALQIMWGYEGLVLNM